MMRGKGMRMMEIAWILRSRPQRGPLKICIGGVVGCVESLGIM
jgi:hypothetical protein